MKKWSATLVILVNFLASSPAFAIDLSNGTLLDIPDAMVVKQFGKLPPSRLTQTEITAMSQFRFAGDTLKVLAVLVDWPERPCIYSAPTYDSLLFSHNIWPGGSVADYYREVSYGKIIISGSVVRCTSLQSYSPNFDFESLLPLLDMTVDFSRFDGNQDGDVDAVIFIRSGTGQEASHDLNDIWSYAMVYPLGYGAGPFDGKIVSRYCTDPELKPIHDPSNPRQLTGAKSIAGIRVYCHELMHDIGLPDLYDYDSKLDTTTYSVPDDANDHPVNDWDVMGYGGYGLFSIGDSTPSHPCGWTKKNAGWISPIVLNVGDYDLCLKNIETTDDSSLYEVPIEATPGEYFLLEFRNPDATGRFDKYDSDFSTFFFPRLHLGADRLDKGLLITHVHDSLGADWWRINSGTPTYPHYTVRIMDAGYNPAHSIYSNPGGVPSDSAQWWYPYETQKGALFSADVPNQTLFGPTTTPSSNGYYGPSGLTVRVDSTIGDRLWVHVTLNSVAPDQDHDGIADAVDNCPAVANANQADLDHDGIGDLCDPCPHDSADVDLDGVCASVDNCPAKYNPLQEDINHDGVGDACCCVGVTGNVNDLGIVDLSDLSSMVSYLTGGGFSLPCPGEANVNQSGVIDLSDLSGLVSYLTGGGYILPNCSL